MLSLTILEVCLERTTSQDWQRKKIEWGRKKRLVVMCWRFGANWIYGGVCSLGSIYGPRGINLGKSSG
jgi:hypothetical protein